MVHLDYLPGTFFGPPTLVDMVRHRVRCQPTDTAFTYLVDGEHEQVQISNAELDRRARAIGAWLESLNLVGERALLLYPPGLEFVTAFFGCLYAGVVAVPVYPPRRNRSLARIQAIADDAEAKVALTTDMVLKRVEPLIDTVPHLKALTWCTTDHVPDGMDRRWERPDIHGDTLAFLQYTSGSTGTPKGVMLNHANLVHNSALIAYAFEHTRSDGGVFWLPSYHDMGLIGGILQPLYLGRPNIIMSPMSFLQKPYRWLSAISRYRATTSGGPNFAYELCVRKITAEQRATLDLSSWTVAFNGAEPVREETIERFTETFAPCGFRREAFYPCFGMAEATLIVSGGFAKKSPVIRAFSTAALALNKVVPGKRGQEGFRGLVGCGSTLPDQDIVIADPVTLTRCPPDGVGEIWLRGPSVAQGYWRQPEATEVTFHAFLKDTGAGPYLRTGDLGFLHERELYVTGRIKDMLIIRGVNVYPQDIEKTVEECHPFLTPDNGAAFTVEAGGRERLVVVHELERRRKGDMTEVFQAIRREISAEHELQVEAIVLVQAGSIPKTSSGKIQRHACRKGYVEGTLDVVAEWHADGQEAPAPATPTIAKEKSRGDREALEEGHDEAPAAAEPVHVQQAPPVRPAVPGGVVGGNGAVSKKINGVAPPRDSAAPADFNQLADTVLEQVRAVARERATGLTLDTPITEIGLDSLERMEILSAIQDRFGGQFPEEILPELETGRQLVAAVEKHLGVAVHGRAPRPAKIEIPEENYRIADFPEYVRLRQRLDLLERSGLGNPFFTVHQGVTNDRTMVGGRQLINFSSYNYIAMSGDPKVTAAVQAAVAQYGSSVSASRLVSGEIDLHGELERALAELIGVENVTVLVVGHATNETVIGHLLGSGDLILHDSLAHNSIVQGAILSGARRRAFPHNDWQAADKLLNEFRHEYRRVLVAIEGVYSMDGDVPDVPRFIEVKKRHKALLMVDEAHSIGVLGATGRGIGEHFALDRKDVEIWMGTLSKTFGSCGGYIGGCKELVEYLKYTAPGFVYSVGLSPPAAAAALAACRLLAAEPERVNTLRRRAHLFTELAQSHGLNTGPGRDSAVVPVILGSSTRCLQLSQALLVRGINVQPIVYPAVEESASRLRFFITSAHSEEQIRYTVAAMVEELGKLETPVAPVAAVV